MRHPLELFVTAIVEGRHECVNLAAPLWSPDATDSLARRALHTAGRPPWSDPRHVARKLRYRLLPRAPRGMCGEGTVPGVIAYDWGSGRELRGLLVMHGVAHQLLLTQPEESNEADAWMLTFALLLPPHDVCLLTDRELLAAAHAPEWAVCLAAWSLRGCFLVDREQSSGIYPEGLTA